MRKEILREMLETEIEQKGPIEDSKRRLIEKE